MQAHTVPIYYICDILALAILLKTSLSYMLVHFLFFDFGQDKTTAKLTWVPSFLVMN